MKNIISQTYTSAAYTAEPIGYVAMHKRRLADAPLHTALPRSIDRLSLLRAVPLFSQLSDTHLVTLASCLGVIAFGRGQTIFQQSDRGDTLYLVARGQVRVYHPSAAGRELSVAIFRAGDFFGELALLDDQPRSASAEAMLPTIALTLGRTAFLATLGGHPVIAEALLAELASRLRASSSFAEHLAVPSAHERVGRLVLDLAQRYGVPTVGGTRIDLCVTQDELASLFGLTRETVNRALARFREQGLVLIERCQLLVPDCAELERACRGIRAEPAARAWDGTTRTAGCSIERVPKL
jgi:CRP/FNR family transcriptional regulator, cyclic AMP receptor protein